jgi:hypothetical protein
MQDFARLVASLTLAWCVVCATPAHAITIAVTATGDLPGFRIRDAAAWLAVRMAGAGLEHWQFEAGDPAHPALNRIEWRFETLPYAGGEVRKFFPMAESRGAMDVHIQGRHRLVSAQARLFLDGQYQTVTLAQDAVRGGADDPDLADFVVSATRTLDVAWHAIDLTPPEHIHARP